MIGGISLQELRTCLTLAEQERRGGVSPRVSPLVQVQSLDVLSRLNGANVGQVSDAGRLLSDSGFKLTSADVDNIIMKYRSAWDLVQHLRACTSYFKLHH